MSQHSCSSLSKRLVRKNKCTYRSTCTWLEILKTMGQLHMLNSELVDQQIAPPTKSFPDAKHIPLLSQRPFHFHCFIGTLSIPSRLTPCKLILCKKCQLIQLKASHHSKFFYEKDLIFKNWKH